MNEGRSYRGTQPQTGNRVFVDESAVVIGKVVLEDDVSIWPQCVLRGDVNNIHVGARSNLQDACVVHVSRPTASNPAGYPTVIGNDVTVAHRALLHGCVIGNRVLIGMAAVIMDGVVIEDEVIVGAGALVTPGKTLASGYLYTGRPARAARPLSEAERAYFYTSAQQYVDLKNDYLD